MKPKKFITTESVKKAGQLVNSKEDYLDFFSWNLNGQLAITIDSRVSITESNGENETILLKVKKEISGLPNGEWLFKRNNSGDFEHRSMVEIKMKNHKLVELIIQQNSDSANRDINMILKSQLERLLEDYSKKDNYYSHSYFKKIRKFCSIDPARIIERLTLEIAQKKAAGKLSMEEILIHSDLMAKYIAFKEDCCGCFHRQKKS